MNSFTKIIISGVLSCLFVMVSLSAFAVGMPQSSGLYSDVPVNAQYYDAVERMSEFKIIRGDDMGLFRPNGFITREQFAKVIVFTLGLDKEAESMARTIRFEDVSKDRWSNQYISYIADMGLMNGFPDGKFYPMEELTYAQICTVLVNATGYTNLEGEWPLNYIFKASQLGYNASVNYTRNEYVPRWATAMMVDNALNVFFAKGLTKLEPDTIFEEYIVFDNSDTYDKLSDNQILTSKGVVNVGDKEADPGFKYYMTVYDGNLVSLEKVSNKTKRLTVTNVMSSDIYYLNGRKIESMKMPINCTYYYHGQELPYDSVNQVVSLNSTIVFAYRQDDTDYEYAVILDPVYSEPEVANSVNERTTSIGEIDITRGVPIIREGEVIEVSEIEDRDVVYSVMDLYKTNKYILVLTDKAEGDIDDILPNRAYPSALVIEGKNYQFDDAFDIVGFAEEKEMFKKDDKISAPLSHDGKILGIYSIKYKTGPFVEAKLLADGRQK